MIAILRAEPGIVKANRSWNKKKGVEKRTEETHLLDKTLDFLLKLAKDANCADSRIHALNIMKFIFSDTYLREDITKFITPAMILSCNEFKNENWNIRNSALMCFTALIKRLLGTHHIQDQDLSRRKGISAIALHYYFNQLLSYFGQKLETSTSKVDKEKQDMTKFSIMLLLSRLVPYSFCGVQESKKDLINTDFRSHISHICDLIRQQSGNSTYFVRKISAQALLPLLEFKDWLPEVSSCLQQLKEKSLKQNEAHGLMLRVNIFLQAYFQYRRVAIVPEEFGSFTEQESKIVSELIGFLAHLQNFTKCSKITWALFVQTFRHFLCEVELPRDQLESLNNQFTALFTETVKCEGGVPLDQQTYVEEMLAIRIELLTQLDKTYDLA